MALLHHCSLSSTKLSKGLFSWERRENSPFFVLAGTLFPVEEAQGPEDWRRLRTGGGEGVLSSPSQTGWEGSSRSVGGGVEARWQSPTSVLSVMVMSGSSFPRWRWMALKYAFMSCMISLSCDGETEKERARGQTGGSLKCLHCHRRAATHDVIQSVHKQRKRSAQVQALIMPTNKGEGGRQQELC